MQPLSVSLLQWANETPYAPSYRFCSTASLITNSAVQEKIDAAAHAAQAESQAAQGSQEAQGRERNLGDAMDAEGLENRNAEGGAGGGVGRAANEKSSGRGGPKRQESDNNPWLAFGNHTAAEQRSYHAGARPRLPTPSIS